MLFLTSVIKKLPVTLTRCYIFMCTLMKKLCKMLFPMGQNQKLLSKLKNPTMFHDLQIVLEKVDCAEKTDILFFTNSIYII